MTFCRFLFKLSRYFLVKICQLNLYPANFNVGYFVLSVVVWTFSLAGFLVISVVYIVGFNVFAVVFVCDSMS